MAINSDCSEERIRVALTLDYQEVHRLEAVLRRVASRSLRGLMRFRRVLPDEWFVIERHLREITRQASPVMTARVALAQQQCAPNDRESVARGHE